MAIIAKHATKAVVGMTSRRGVIPLMPNVKQILIEQLQKHIDGSERTP